jgi:hypothetical protein
MKMRDPVSPMLSYPVGTPNRNCWAVREARLVKRINAAARRLHRLWSERAAGVRYGDSFWVLRVRALDAAIANAYEARRRIRARASRD